MQYFACVYFCDPLSSTQLVVGELCWDKESDQCIGYKAIEGRRLDATLQFFRTLFGPDSYATDSKDIERELEHRAAKPASYWLRKDQYPSINQLGPLRPALYKTNEEALARLGSLWKDTKSTEALV